MDPEPRTIGDAKRRDSSHAAIIAFAAPLTFRVLSTIAFPAAGAKPAKLCRFPEQIATRENPRSTIAAKSARDRRPQIPHAGALAVRSVATAARFGPWLAHPG